MLALFVLAVLGLTAYAPSRMLFLHDGPDVASYDILHLFSSGGYPQRALRMDAPKFALPRLIVDGKPVYSHVLIVGRGDHLTQENYNALYAYVEGSLDPAHSRLTEDERFLLPADLGAADDAGGLLGQCFDPLPGAHILVVTDAKASKGLKNLLRNIGVSAYVPPAASSAADKKGSKTPLALSTDLAQAVLNHSASGFAIIPPTVKYTPVDADPGSLLAVDYKFKSDKIPAQDLFSVTSDRKQHTVGAAWRGGASNVRVVFLGFMGLLADLDAMYAERFNISEAQDTLVMQKALVPPLYEVGKWFNLLSGVLRVRRFEARIVKHPGACTEAMAYIEGQNSGNTLALEGNLIHYVVQMEELVDKRWVPYVSSRTHESTASLLAAVGPAPGLHPQEAAQLEKQVAALRSGAYDTCLLAARRDHAQEYARQATRGRRAGGKDATDALDLSVASGRVLYTDVQLEESIMGQSFGMNFAVLDSRDGLLDMVILPDLVRSYHPRLDYNRQGYNRINIMHHLHVNMNRIDANKLVLSDAVFLFTVVNVVALAMYASLVVILRGRSGDTGDAPGSAPGSAPGNGKKND